jgi:hypothetical protein
MTDQNPPQKPFQPWWRDCRKAAACLLGAAGAVLFSLILRAHGDGGPAPLILAILPLPRFLLRVPLGSVPTPDITATALKRPHVRSSSASCLSVGLSIMTRRSFPVSVMLTC